MSDRITKPVQTEAVFDSWDYIVFALLSLVSLFVTGTFLEYWLSLRGWVYHPISSVISKLIFLVVIVNYFGRWFLLPYMRRPKPMAARPGWRVAVVTTVVPGNEPLDMLEVTLKCMVAIDYPHDIWVLDEEDSDEVKALCEKLGVYHFSRKGMASYQTRTGTFQSRTKHGNYNAWLYETAFDRYDIITSFDPDHIPAPNFLSRVLGYFDDPDVGYVQAAQVYYNQEASFIARGAAEETYAYYSSIQMASYGMGYPIIIGCHNTHRVTALKEVGGFATHEADDLLITLYYRSHGWQGVYVPEILARGLTPVDWDGYLTQQRRWARSVLDIKLRLYHKLDDNLSLKTRVISFLHGFNYLYKSFIILAGVLLTLFMLATGTALKLASLPALPRFGLFCLVLLLCDLYRQRFYLDPEREYGLHWRAGLLQFGKWPYTLLALCEVILKRRTPYALTSKVKSGRRRHMIFWPHLWVSILVLVCWGIGAASGRITEPLLHVWGGFVAAGSLALALTDFLRFPAPFDKKLIPSTAQERLKQLEYN